SRPRTALPMRSGGGARPNSAPITPTSARLSAVSTNDPMKVDARLPSVPKLIELRMFSNEVPRLSPHPAQSYFVGLSLLNEGMLHTDTSKLPASAARPSNAGPPASPSTSPAA